MHTLRFYLYVLACLLLPTAWGAAVAAVVSYLEKRRGAWRDPHDAPPYGYEI